MSMYERALRVDDPIGDVVGGFGTGYEIYSIEIGITGDRMDFRVRTNFNPRSRGGDVILEFGNELAAIAVESRQLDNGQEVIRGDFYRDISLLMGRVVPWPYRIAEWQEWITGYSGISVIDDIICMGVDFALFGWLDFAACGGLPDCVGWTMWCGNDWVEIVINSAPTGDFNSDGVVDNDDLVIWQEGFGTTSGADLSNGDSDADGDVDGNDFLAWQQNFGSSTIPELPADFNSDGDVDNDDLGIWEDGFGTTVGANEDDGDADGDGDVDGNDFLAWQLNFGSNTSSGSTEKSFTGSAATDQGSSPSLITTNTSSVSSNNGKDNPVGLVQSSVGNCQSTSIFPADRQLISFDVVDYASWPLPKPMQKTIGSTTTRLTLPQFQLRDVFQPFQRNRAVDAVMSRLDRLDERTDLEHLHDRVHNITLTNFTTVYDEKGMASRAGKTSIREIKGPFSTVEDRADLDTALEELTIESMLKSRGLI
ncbi:MAG: hypothetical protein JW829_02600 [Pirellulales bacterium]|nr:hypothetical protein [Pirellulales bacterium]